MPATSVRLNANRETKGGLGHRLLPLIALFALALPFAVPLTQGRYPLTDDGLLHLVRLIGLDHAVQHGALWPRFMPALHYGYGSPLFNYSGPLSLYPAELFHLLGMGFSNALLWATVLWGLFGMLGAYRLGQSLGSPVAGLVAGAGFLYSGQLDYFGNTAQFAALSFLPWALWAVRLLARQRRRRDFLLAVAFIAAPVLTHNITAMVSAALAAAYAVYLVLTEPHGQRGRASLALGAAIAGALGVSTLVWLPALAERGAVQLARLSFFDFHEHFLSLAQILTLPAADAPGRWLFPPGEYALHWPQIGLAAAAAVLALRPGSLRSKQRVGLLGYYLAALVALVSLTTRASQPVWDAVPLMRYIEFPKRLLLPTSLLLAVLAGLGAGWVAEHFTSGRARAGWVAICLAAIILYAFPQLDLEYLSPQPPDESVLDAHEIERSTGWLGGTSAGEYLPVWVAEPPHSWRFTDRFAAQDVFPRLEANDAVQVLDEAWGLVSGAVQVEAAEPTTLTFEWFYFPGWRAWVDGEEVETAPSEGTGLLAVRVPAGVHGVRVRFGLTPLRRAATLLSGLAAAMVAAVTLLPRRLWRRDLPPPAAALSRGELAAAILVGVALFGLRLLLV